MSSNGIFTSVAILSLIILLSDNSTSPFNEFESFNAVSVISSNLDKSVVYANPQAPLFKTLILADIPIPVFISSIFPSFINIDVELLFPALISI